MSRDIFLRWPNELPSRYHVLMVLEDLLRGMATFKNDRDDNRIYVYLPGSPSWPFDRMGPSCDNERAYHRSLAKSEEGPRPRWIEVVFTTRRIDILTRHQDPITNAIAREIAKTLIRGFGGEVDHEISDSLSKENQVD